ncbi:MAG: hypothetical protein ABSF53_20640 [Terracidiphilus sp.]
MTICRSCRFAALPLLAVALLLATAGCKSNPSANQDQPAAADVSSDPANANLAPISNTQAAPSSSDQASAPVSSDNGSSSGPSDQSDDSYYGEQPAETATEPPPPLPDYQQPPAPADDYLWTPGYWDYAPTGYYWVPGVWVQAPYQGALWTPCYWGWFHNRYAFFRGYWGPHIGYYGGVNYGFGYAGVGYQGGYWNSGRFYVNRAVNNVNVTIVHNVYNRTVIVNNNVRVSYNGGPGGIQARPMPAELAALREPHAPPMTTQLQNQREASVNRAQFVAVNHGRPADLVIAKPLVADRDVRPVAPPPMRVAPAPARAGVPEPRPAISQPTPAAPRPGAAPPPRVNEPVRPEGRPNTPPPAHAAAPVRPAAPPAAHPAERPAPARPEPTPRTAPKPQVEQRPAPKPQVEQRPNQPHPEERPAPEKPRPPAGHFEP